MRKLLSLIIVPLVLASCAVHGADPAVPPAAGPVATSSTVAQMRALIGAAACTASSQCHTVAVGARACGGPESYLAWSSAQTEAAPLLALAERYRNERKADIVKSGEMSTCRFMPDPGAQCLAGTCQLRNGEPAAM